MSSVKPTATSFYNRCFESVPYWHRQLSYTCLDLRNLGMQEQVDAARVRGDVFEGVWKTAAAKAFYGCSLFADATYPVRLLLGEGDIDQCIGRVPSGCPVEKASGGMLSEGAINHLLTILVAAGAFVGCVIGGALGGAALAGRDFFVHDLSFVDLVPKCAQVGQSVVGLPLYQIAKFAAWVMGSISLALQVVCVAVGGALFGAYGLMFGAFKALYHWSNPPVLTNPSAESPGTPLAS